MAISKVKLPDNTTQDIHDSRVVGVDSSPTSGSNNLVTSGGVYNALQSVDTSSCEKLVNKVTSISASSTDTEYPSAKAVYEATQNLVSYPTFEINNAMHLTMSSPDASALSLFSVDNNGHLIMTV